MEVKELPIKAITVAEGRQRTALSGIADLAASMQTNGLINPITVDTNGMLIAGERRLTAAVELEWPTIACRIFPADNILTRELIEFEENAKRVDLPWRDRCAAIVRYHKLLDGSPKQTAKHLGLSKQHVYDNLKVATVLDDDATNQMANFITALNYAKRLEERQKEAALAAVTAPDPLQAVADILAGGGGITQVDVEETPIATDADVPFSIEHYDFMQWAKDYHDEPFNLIHCDFPYGVKAGEKTGQGSARHMGEYRDDAATYLRLLDFLCDDCEHVIAPAAHLIFWFDMSYYVITKQRLIEAGWTIFPHPLIWYKVDNRGIIPDSARQFRRVYETAFFGHRGDRKIVRTAGNACSGATDTSRHPSCKPLPILRHFFTPLVDSSTRLLDPTCGGGTSIQAGRDLKAAYSLGLELDEGWADAAREQLGQPMFVSEEAVLEL